MSECRRFVVTGRVQGVFFRDWTVEHAERLGLDGWVRNRADGGVEAVACGPADALASFEASLRHGSTLSRVDDVAVTTVGDVPPPGFARLPTG